jgi:hypothetical protein
VIEVRIPVPRGLLPALLGLAGALAMVVAIGGLTGSWWWSVLAGGAVAVWMSYVATTGAPAGPREPTGVEQTGGRPR